MKLISHIEFEKLNNSDQWEIFKEGINIGGRTIQNGKFTWCCQYDYFYIIQTLEDNGSRKFIAITDLSEIEYFLLRIKLPDL